MLIADHFSAPAAAVYSTFAQTCELCLQPSLTWRSAKRLAPDFSNAASMLLPHLQ